MVLVAQRRSDALEGGRRCHFMGQSAAERRGGSLTCRMASHGRPRRSLIGYPSDERALCVAEHPSWRLAAGIPLPGGLAGGAREACSRILRITDGSVTG